MYRGLYTSIYRSCDQKKIVCSRSMHCYYSSLVETIYRFRQEKTGALRENNHLKQRRTDIQCLNAYVPADTHNTVNDNTCTTSNVSQQNYNSMEEKTYKQCETIDQMLSSDESNVPLLGGIQISIKDNFCVKDTRTTAGSTMLSNFTAPYDATVVSKLRTQGASFCGKTVMDEFGMGSSTLHSIHGATKNPYTRSFLEHKNIQTNDPWLVPGGSSGGSAVSVATGSCHASVGSDTGGSVRQPAAFTGIVGLKPTYGRVSRHGLIAYGSSLDCPGILTRHVGDAAFLFDLLASRDTLDSTNTASYSSRNVSDTKRQNDLLNILMDDTSNSVNSTHSLDHFDLSNSTKQQTFHSAMCPWKHNNHSVENPFSLKGLRVGIPAEFNIEELADDIRSVWLTGIEMLHDCGATIVPVSIPHIRASLAAYYVIAPAEATSNLSRYDGVRYGIRTSTTSVVDDSTETLSETVQNALSNAYEQSAEMISEGGASALHDLYTKTRSYGFGNEVQRRLFLGNFVLSQEAKSEYFHAACEIRRRLQIDFARVLGYKLNQDAHVAFSQTNKDVLAANEESVHVLLTPTTPTGPWTNEQATSMSSIEMYSNDVMTTPINLAGLPAINVPITMIQQQSIKLNSDMEPSSFQVPVGLQLIGQPFGEALMLYTAAALESQAQFHAKVPLSVYPA